MKTNHTEAKKRPARTTFKLTDREVEDALAHYLEDVLGVEVPKGKRLVWVRDISHHSENDPLTTLVVDHDDKEEEATE